LGVYPVEEARDPCHLVELRLEPETAGEKLDLRAVTQEASGHPGTSWQTPSGEYLLDVRGELGRFLENREAAGVRAPARVAFFFHFLRSDRPLLTPAGPVLLPPATPRPVRLSFIHYI
jgi:hypothetical protein